jgi:hypothetical protein
MLHLPCNFENDTGMTTTPVSDAPTELTMKEMRKPNVRAIRLTNLGEMLVQELIQRKPACFLKLSGLSPTHTAVYGGRVFVEAKLEQHEGKRFDGASRVDLVVPLNATEALPIEVKLGDTRLSKSRIEDDWLNSRKASVSHKGTAWAGNMMWVLDRLVKDRVTHKPLKAKLDEVEYSLTAEWCLIVRKNIKEKWGEKGGPNHPDFRHAHIVVFEDLVSEFEQAEFDSIVRDLVTFPYYDEWITRV